MHVCYADALRVATGLYSMVGPGSARAAFALWHAALESLDTVERPLLSSSSSQLQCGGFC